MYFKRSVQPCARFFRMYVKSTMKSRLAMGDVAAPKINVAPLSKSTQGGPSVESLKCFVHFTTTGLGSPASDQCVISDHRTH